MKVVISEPALDALLAYRDRNPDLVAKALARLDEGRCTVLQLAGSTRAVWVRSIDDDVAIYFTHGQAAGDEELRITFVGPPPSELNNDLRQVLYMAGEIDFQDLPGQVRVEDRRDDTLLPTLPSRELGPERTLQSYLEPSEESMLRVMERLDDPDLVDDLHGRRYRVFAGLRTAQQLPIRLSPQQQRLLRHPLPMLIQGTAGSGKTTLVAHLAHQQLLGPDSPSSILVVAYTQELVDFTGAILAALDELDGTDSASTQLRTWRNLCADLVTSAGLEPITWAPDNFFFEQLTTYARGEKRHSSAVSQAEELFEFIRSTLKGQIIDGESPLMSRKAALAMPHSSVDRFMDRRQAYEIAANYQFALASNGLSDDSDAAWRLLTACDSLPKYDYVLVDEAQDYTLVQLVLLSKLCKDTRHLVFAGDVNQALYPSHFTWERARSALWFAGNTDPPPTFSIEYNYRNPQPITEMSNALLKMRAKSLDLAVVEPSKSNQPLTPRPMRLVLSQERIDALVRDMAVRVGSFAVIYHGTAPQIIIDDIPFERSFTPRTVKGLEFNVVCLVNFNESYQQLASKSNRKRRKPRSLDFNEVYVAVTRAREQLILLDRTTLTSGLWESSQLAPFIDQSESEPALRRLVEARYENRSRGDWEIDALNFESQQAFAAAGECWERAGNLRNAARNYERGGRWQRALEIYISIDDFDGCARCAVATGRAREAATFFERAGQFGAAASTWAKLGDYAQAARLYLTAAEAAPGIDKWELAGRYHRMANSFEVAARCYERAQLLDEAIDCWILCGELLRTAALQDTLGRARDAATSRAKHYEARGQPEEAGRQWAKAGEHPRAAQLLDDAGQAVSAAREWLLAGDPHRAADRFEAGGDLGSAAAALEQAGDSADLPTLVRLLIALDRPERAAQLLAHAGEHQRAAQLMDAHISELIQSRRYREAALFLRSSGRHLRAMWWAFRARLNKRADL
jgi:tetratricopeptide (TPR) repeat protein